MNLACDLLVLCLSVRVFGKSTAVVPNGLPEASRSPKPNFLREILDSFRGPDGVNVTHFLSTFRLPSCMEQCFPEMDGLLKALAKSNKTEDVAEVCNELQSSARCASTVGCSELFTEATASAFQFVCLDNFQSIAETVECVKKTISDIQPECEARCEVHGQLLEDASKNKIDTLFNGPRACNSTRCLLTCFKKKIDKRCEIDQTKVLDTLMKEVMHDYDENKSWEDVISYIMPDYCKGKAYEREKTVQNEESQDGKPQSVGKVSKTGEKKRNPKNSKSDWKEELDSRRSPTKLTTKSSNVKETTVVLDGEIRTLRYELLDWQGHPVPSPDFETLAGIMTQKLRPPFHKAGHPENADQNEGELNSKVDVESAESVDWRPEDRPEILSREVEIVKEGVSVTIGLAIFVATVLYWLWETARDLD